MVKILVGVIFFAQFLGVIGIIASMIQFHVIVREIEELDAQCREAEKEYKIWLEENGYSYNYTI